MKLLLDTNAYSAMVHQHEMVQDHVRRARSIVFSAVVVGELLHGFRGGSKFNWNLHELRRFLAQPETTLLHVTWDTADRYSRIIDSLQRKGKPIPSNDVWIAAHAMETGADLISFDQHFAQVDGLAWIDPSR